MLFFDYHRSKENYMIKEDNKINVILTLELILAILFFFRVKYMNIRDGYARREVL